jgi:acyl-CoA dehydrogenase
MIDFELKEAQKNVRDMVHFFAETQIRPLSKEADRTGEVPREFLKMVAKMGIGAEPVPKEIGGEGEGVGEQKDKKGAPSTGRTSVIAAEEIAWGDAGIVLSLPGPGLGGPPVRIMGTPEQQKRFFGVFTKDDEPHWGAFALTEPGAGSDVAAISTTAVKDGNYYIINGTKQFITNGARADWNVVFATIDKKLGRAGHRAFVIEKGTPGFKVGKIEEKMGLRASETAELVFEDCRVHKDNLLGGEEYYAKKAGFKGAMGTFDASRPMVGAMAVGIARAAYEYSLNWVKENYMLSRPIPKYAIIKDMFATMARKIEAARLLCWKAAYMLDLKLPNAKEASMAKAYSAQIAMETCINAIQVMGSQGLSKDHLVEKWFRDIKVYDIFEGTGQVQRIVISRRLLGLSGSEAS